MAQRRCEFAHAFLWEYSCEGLKLAQLLGQQPRIFLTCAARSPRLPAVATGGSHSGATQYNLYGETLTEHSGIELSGIDMTFLPPSWLALSGLPMRSGMASVESQVGIPSPQLAVATASCVVQPWARLPLSADIHLSVLNHSSQLRSCVSLRRYVQWRRALDDRPTHGYDVFGLIWLWSF